MGCCLNNVLQGCALNEIDGVVVSKLQAELKEYQELLQPILKAIEITMRSAEKVQVHMSGAKNMLAFPEFSDIQKAKSLIQTLEEKDQLVTMLKESSGNDIQIMIGIKWGIIQEVPLALSAQPEWIIHRLFPY